MKLFTKEIEKRLLKNGEIRCSLQQDDKVVPDFLPVVKLFTPDAGCTWLLTELDPDNPDLAFGLCDLGLGTPELGYVSMAELASVRGQLGLPVERDRYFSPSKTLKAYTEEARTSGHIQA